LGGTGATNNTWANNIFKKNSGDIFTNANSGTTWVGNIRSGTLGISSTTGMTSPVDPILELNADGYFGLTSNSPAINSSNSNYPPILNIDNIDNDPTLLLDISGQTRVGTKDVGCDEYSTETTTNHPLALSEVGPSYLFTEAPTATSPQTICAATVASLSATGTDLKWYDTPTSGSPLSPSTAITSGTYYVSQTLNGVESTRRTVLVSLQTTTAPTASNQSHVGPATVASLVATGTALKWYSLSTGGSALDPSTALTNGTTYYVSQTLNSCESTRTAAVVTIQIATQTITFTTLPLKYTNSPDFDPAAVSSNRSPITYSSSNQTVATITNDNKIHIVARGTSDITASSVGAAPITTQLIVQCSCVIN
jgi:hypothetical protein